MRIVPLFSILAICCCCGGCDWLVYGGYLDPTVLGSYHGGDRTLEIRTSISLNDDPEGIAGAVEPGPEDSVAVIEEYRVAAGDQVVIRILQLVAEDLETTIAKTVNNLGEVYLPILREWFKIEGMTVREAQLAIADLVKEQQIVRDPEVEVEVATRRSSTYTIFGLVGQQGMFQIQRPNFRLLEALTLSGGLSEQAEKIYVFRSVSMPERRVEPDEALRSRSSRSRSTMPYEESPFTPGELFSAGLNGTGPAPATNPSLPQSSPASGPSRSRPVDPGQREALLEALAPATSPATSPTTSGPAPESGLSKWIWLNGEWVEVRQGPTTRPAESFPTEGVTSWQTAPSQTAPAAETQPPGTLPTQPIATPESVDWDETLAGEPDQRILEIPGKPLREGDPRYNIVIRPGDVIRVPPGPVGEFFMGGYVTRPGTYDLTGRKITLKQAIVSAGGLAVLAWPERCEIIRRTDDDRETVIQLDLRKIFEYKEDGLYLKPNDIVMVGTHAVAPFLATIRNSFRMSYGFGFVYDRNFADIDSFSQRINPSILRAQNQGGSISQFFPSLFR